MQRLNCMLNLCHRPTPQGAVHCFIYHLAAGQGTLAYQAINEAFKLLAAEEQCVANNFSPMTINTTPTFKDRVVPTRLR